MASNDPRKKNPQKPASALQLGINASTTPSGEYVVSIVATSGALSQGISFPVPEDVQESVAIADYFYKELLGAFAEGGKARAAARKKA